MFDHTMPKPIGMTVSGLIADVFDPLRFHISTGQQQVLAMTCHHLFAEIMARLREHVQRLVRRPIGAETIHRLWCKHHCNPEQTLFVLDFRYGRVTAHCTHCLHSRSTDTSNLHPELLWPEPPDNVQVEKIVQDAGARHSLLVDATLFKKTAAARAASRTNLRAVC